MVYPSFQSVYDVWALPKAFICPECGAFLEAYIEQDELRSEIREAEVEIDCIADTGLDEHYHDYESEKFKEMEKQAIAWCCQYLRVNKNYLIEEIK